MTSAIYIRGKRYNYYDTYQDTEWQKKEMHDTCKYWKKKNGSKWFIVKCEKGILFPETVYKLYLTKVARLWG